MSNLQIEKKCPHPACYEASEWEQPGSFSWRLQSRKKHIHKPKGFVYIELKQKNKSHLIITENSNRTYNWVYACCITAISRLRFEPWNLCCMSVTPLSHISSISCKNIKIMANMQDGQVKVEKRLRNAISKFMNLVYREISQVKRSFWLKGRFKLIKVLIVDDYLIVTILFYLRN